MTNLTNQELYEIVIRLDNARKKYIDENRKIPAGNSIEQKCICCSKKIEILDINDKYPANNTNWNNGTADIVCPGYASRYDMVELLIGLCDDCIEQAIKDGRIVWTFNLINISEEYLKEI